MFKFRRENEEQKSRRSEVPEVLKQASGVMTQNVKILDSEV